MNKVSKVADAQGDGPVTAAADARGAGSAVPASDAHGGNPAGKDMQGVDPMVPGLKMPKARPGMRLVGYCKVCRCFEELDAQCRDHMRHDRHDMALIMEVPKGEPLPEIPAFNWGAFLMPPIWGAGHGQVFAVVLYPLWLMVDNLMWGAIHGQASPLLAGLSLVGTLAFMFYYARTANYVAYMRVITTTSPKEFVARERKWAIAMAVVALAMVAFATWYNLTMRAA